ncbi:MAG: hypothetical protein QW303_07195 [Nitrososphaerota archaeon]
MDKILKKFFIPQIKKETLYLLNRIKKYDCNSKLCIFGYHKDKFLISSYKDEVNLYNNNIIKNRFFHNGFINSAIFNKKGNKVLTSSNDKTVKLHGNQIKTFEHQNTVQFAVFNKSENKIITLSKNIVHIWDLEGNKLNTLNHDHNVNFLFPNTKFILTSSFDCIVRLWDHNTLLFPHREYVNSVVSSFYNNLILTSSENKAIIWNKEGKKINILEHDCDIYFVIDTYKNIITTGSNQAFMWNHSGKLLRIFNHDNIYYAILNPITNNILTVSNNTAKLWDYQGKIITTFYYKDYIKYLNLLS